MSDVRALLVTDVVDSTRLVETLGEGAAAALWAAHDRAARDLLAVHGGREIDKTDGFLLLFDDAASAAAYALAYHRALAPLDLRARTGLHVGPVVLTANAPEDVARGAKALEVDGLAKPVAARVMSVAQGGQTLLTREARDSLGDTPLRVESHGHWRLKGVAEPVELFEVGDGDAPFTPPPDGAKVYRVVEHGDLWLPVREVPHSLPAERDAFVGRDSDLQALHAALQGGARLVTVLGIGGTGKTRLVVRFAWTWLGDYPGGVWFCDLSEARGMEGIATAVARALDVPLGTGDPIMQLGHAIAGRGRCLVVLDNFEQVARHARESLGRWLDRASDASFVVTSREVLGLPGERALALAPLDDDAAVDLFVARAVQAKQDFALTRENETDVRGLVQLMDGLPLAVELAAARVRLMPPRVLRQRMGERFRLLSSSGGRHTRHATLRATLDWSWDLLSTDEQRALAQVSVFEGGFTFEAAEAVLELEELWAADALQALLDKSLLRRVGDDRFDLLVSVQEYAADKLAARGACERTEARHGAHYAEYGTPEALDALESADGVARARALAPERDNLVTAIRRAVVRGDALVAARCLEVALVLLVMRGPIEIAIDLAQSVLSLPKLAPCHAGPASRVLADALQVVGRGEEAAAAYAVALAAYRESGDRREEARALCRLGSLHSATGSADDGHAAFDAAREILRDGTDRRGDGRLHAALGALHAREGRLDEAQANFEVAAALCRELGDRRSEARLLGNLGNVHMLQRRVQEADALYDAAVLALREVGDRRSEAIVGMNLARLRIRQGRVDDGRAHLDAALTACRQIGNRPGEGHALASLGAVHAIQGRTNEAFAHYAAALEIHREVGDPQLEASALYNLADLHMKGGRLAEARSSLDAAEQIVRTVADLAELGSVLAARARLEHAAGRADAARRALDEADAVAREAGAAPDSDLGEEIAEARAALEGGAD